MHTRGIVMGVVLGVSALAGCAGEAAPPNAVPAPAAAAQAGEPVSPEKLALSKELQAELEKFTPRRFTGPVAVANQTREEFRSYVAQAMDEGMPEADAAGASAALVALGLLREGVDLRKEIADAFVSQVAAYYDPAKDTFYPISAGLPEAQERLVFVHELQHALQDHALGLDAVLGSIADVHNGDREQAVRYLLEGEAHWVSIAWSVKDQNGADLLKDDNLAKKVFRGPARLSFDDTLAQARANLAGMGPEGRKQVEALETIPRVVIREQLDAYIVGAWGVHRIFKHGGWKALDGVWAAPPTSTEQMLHPLEKLLGDAREEPVDVAVPDLSSTMGVGWSRVHANTLGEAGIYLLLSEQLPEMKLGRARSGSAGWGGDRLAAWTKPGTARPVVTWLTVWDSDRDATQFFEAYGFAAEARNGLREWPAGGQKMAGRAVAIVEGIADAAWAARLLDALLAAAPRPPAPK